MVQSIVLAILLSQTDGSAGQVSISYEPNDPAEATEATEAAPAPEPFAAEPEAEFAPEPETSPPESSTPTTSAWGEAEGAQDTPGEQTPLPPPRAQRRSGGVRPAGPSPDIRVPDETPRSYFRGALELSGQALPSGTPGGEQDIFLVATPLIAVDGGPDVGFELGASLRLRMLDGAPEQRDEDIYGGLRGADWDEPSDFGQLLRALWIGSDASWLQLRAGPVDAYTLGHGHLIARYANLTNPDYHPAAASLLGFVGPVRAEVFTSDVLGARIFAADVAVDLSPWVGFEAHERDSAHVSLSVAHDAGQAGYLAPSLTLVHLDGDYAIYRGPEAQVFATLGAGSRVSDDPAFGFLAGVSAEGEPGGIQVGAKVELRQQAGGFRHGMIGADYELARFSGTGFGQPALADERLPAGFSAYAEVATAYGPVAPVHGGQPRISFTAAAQHYFWGRTDGDAHLLARLPGGLGTVGARASVVGFGQTPRYFFQGELRYRLLSNVYTLGYAGTAFFPQPDGTLERGVQAGVGIAVDFER